MSIRVYHREKIPIIIYMKSGNMKSFYNLNTGYIFEGKINVIYFLKHNLKNKSSLQLTMNLFFALSEHLTRFYFI